jgi:hypothetical protein
VFQLGGNTFYYQKNIIPIKIPEFKRSGIGIITEFCGIPSRFSNQLPKFNWVVGCKLEELPEFYCLPPTWRGAKVTFRFVLPTLMPMAATGVLLGDVVFALAFAETVAVAAALTFGGGKG